MSIVCRLKYILAVAALCLAVVVPLSVVAARAEEEQDKETEEQPLVAVTIIADGKEFKYSDEKIIPSDFSVAEQIELRRINAPLISKIALVDAWLEKGADYKTALDVCFPRLKYTVAAAAGYMNEDAVDAQVVYKNGRFGVTREQRGRKLDENMLYANIYCCLKFSGGGTVKAGAVTVEPTVTQSELKANLIRRSSYTTDFRSSTAARAHNVALALSKFDGISIPAGGTLSFNQTVGARTEENGFKSAKIIVDGKYTDGVGGGVCQASTAMYNAALTAGLSATANAHSICPSYCDAGLDAMISSVSDLVITNTTEHTVYISARTTGGRGTVTVFGEPSEYTVVPDGVTLSIEKHECVELVDKEHKYFDEQAEAGDRLLVSPGKDGVKSETYLNYYKAGELVKRVKIRENTYRSTPQVIAVAPESN